MATLHDDILDNGLAALDNADVLHICSAEPSSFANVSAVTLGNKASPSIGAVGDRTGGGRKRTVAAIADGEVTGTGTASHWALVDAANSKLLAANTLSSSQSVTDGNTFTLAAFDVGIPDPA